MSSNPIRLQQLLRKYLDSTCSKAELKELWQLLSELSENDLVADELKALWDKTPATPDNSRLVQKQKHLAKILKKGREQEFDFEKVHRRQNRRWYISGIAAVIMLVVAAGLWMLWLGYQKQDNGMAVTEGITDQPVTTHKTLTLPDGTRVTVNLNTKLEYPKEFTGSTREVYLSGEAFFDVTHDSTKPFLVHTGAYTTRVLGTKFNINAYPGNNQITVTVSQGKVQVEDKSSVIKTLLPSDQLVIEKTTGTVAAQKVNAVQVTEWKDEDLVFDNISFEEAAAIITQRFGVTLQFNNEKIKRCRFTSTFFSSNGLDQIMDILTTITNTTWVKEDVRLITINGEGCESK